MNKVLCITGMHRSGTSLAASWLQHCGVQIDNGQMVGASVGNIKGHFEDKEFVDLHSQIVQSQLKESKGWIVWQDPVDLKLRKLRAEEIIKARAEKYNLWGWKDPRSVLFLEEWKKIIPDLKFVFIWRPASEVVGSMLNRYSKSQHPTDSISRWNGYRTWYNYNSLIKNFYTRFPEDCILLSLESLINNDQKLFDKISKKFQMEINYYPISSIAEKSMFSEKELKIKDRFFLYLYNTTALEKELLALNLK